MNDARQNIKLTSVCGVKAQHQKGVSEEIIRQIIYSEYMVNSMMILA
jgi:hypothetical protein